MKQSHAIVRSCVCCAWIFRSEEKAKARCPKCDSPTVGARHLLGDACYTLEVTQHPWIDQKVEAYRAQLCRDVLAKPDTSNQITIQFSPSGNGEQG